MEGKMDNYLIALKDVLVVLAPILIAYINYRSNKKTEKDIRLEIEKNLKEKDADTFQMVQKIYAELESQKQLTAWNNSLTQTEEYTKLAGAERYGNICSLADLTNKIQFYINNNNLSVQELNEIKILLAKVDIPLDSEHLYAYEVPFIIEYNKLIKVIDGLIQDTNCGQV